MKTLALAISVLFSVLLFENLFAQSHWLAHTDQNSIYLEWDKPVFDSDYMGGEIITPLSSVLFLSGRIKVNDHFFLIAELPVSHYGGEYRYFDFREKYNSHTAIGNIYLGGEYMLSSTASTLPSIKFGLRLPTLAEPQYPNKMGVFTGIFSEFDRGESFWRDSWSVRVLGSLVNLQANNNLELKVNTGFSYNIFTGEISDYLDNMLHLLYSFTATWKTPVLNPHMAVFGRNPIHGNDAEFLEDGITQLRFGVGKDFNTWSATVFVRRPLTSYIHDIVNFSYGINLNLNI